MSDLSDFVNMDFAAQPPAVKFSTQPVEKSQHASYRWPTPPFAAYPDALTQHQAQGCEFVGTNGSRVCGRLIFFVPDDQVAHVQVPPARTTMPLRFDQFRSLRVMQPLKPASTSSTEPNAEVLSQRPRSSYRVVLSEGGTLEGQTIGHVENAHGLFLFPPVDDKGTVQRLFMPRCAYVSYEVGSRIGETLVEQQAATPQQVEQAAELQAQLRHQRLGDILLTRQLVTSAQLLEAIDKQSRTPTVKLGEALLSLGMVSQEQLNGALEQQSLDRRAPLGELLVRMGVVTRADLQAALARKMGYPLVDLDAFQFEADAIRKLPYAVAVRVQVMPLMIREGRLVLAMDDPVRRRAVVDEVEFITQMKVVPVLAQCDHLKAVQLTAYDRVGAATALQFVPPPTGAYLPAELQDPNPSTDIDDSDAAAPDDSASAGTLLAPLDTTPAALVAKIIIDAHQAGVSDIHIESDVGNDKLKVRYRKNGLLSTHVELPASERSALITRIKLMCDLDIGEGSRAQDGKLDFARFSPPHPIELRVTIVPTAPGIEDAVLHVLNAARPMALDALGLSEHNLSQLKEALERPQGLVLCAGPAGAGKTTSLHAALAHINVPERKIWTAEDPIEITQPGLRQVLVNHSRDWGYAQALQAFLRADPDVIMVDELRERETAQLSLEAALGGHLVLSGLPTHSAAEAVSRLLHMGLGPFNVADALSCVLAQRLVRRLCSHCRRTRLASEAEVDELLDDYLHDCTDEDRAFKREALRTDWLLRFGDHGDLMLHDSAGCALCGHSGYQGRAALHELLRVSRELRHLIQTGAHADALQATATREGMRTLRQDGIEKVWQGITSLGEVRAACSA